ncbi:MAG TPA: DUF1631 family protein [Luteimonas sp.]|nr:DUF1631 family protein [Luteimonas sp.]
MRNSFASGDASGAGRDAHGGGSGPGSQLLDALRRGFVNRTLPMLGEMQAAAELDIRQALGDEQAARGNDSLTNLGILRREAARYERRWQEHVDARFAGWPSASAVATRLDAYTLVSEDQLQAQLIGQPVIEALERRLADVIDVIDSRLWSLAASLGSGSRPANPFAPRMLVETILSTFPIAECDVELRQAMLRQFERIAGARLGAVYAWLNTQLAEAGYAMAGNGDYAALVAQPTAVTRDGAGGRWADDNALQPRQSSWRGNTGLDATADDASRGNALRAAMRSARASEGGADARREFSDKELLSVLSLLQGSETPQAPLPVSGSIRDHLRESLVAGAASLGMPRDSARLAARHEDTIDLIGHLFDGLRTAALLGAEADARLARLAWPMLRLALDDARIFDEDDPAAFAVLDALVRLWDANAGATDVDVELLAVADSVADQVANDYHGDATVFARARASLDAKIEPLRRRAEIAERRAWQTILGRERLQAARAEGDHQLGRLLDGRRMLPRVAEFLSDQWWQALVHAWLREGPDSARLRGVLAVGEAMVKVDDDAAHARGRAVAEGLIALEEPLRGCFVACGLDESGANELLAALVAQLAQPDAARIVPTHTPTEPSTGHADVHGPSELSVGQVVLATLQADTAPHWSRVAWISPLSNQVLLVSRQGARVALLSADTVRAQLASGWLRPRDDRSPVQAALAALVPP